MTQQQRDLFDRDIAPWERDDAEQRAVASVVFPTGPTDVFDYLIPEKLAGQVEPGRRVRVPLGRGNRSVLGYCVATEYRPLGSRRLKEVARVVDPRALLTPAMVRLTRWIADYYLCNWGQVLETVLPAGVRGGAGTRDTLLLSVPPPVRSKLGTLKLPKKQAAALEILAASTRPMLPAALANAAGCTQAPIDNLRRKGLITAETVRLRRDRFDEPEIQREASLKLNPDQRQALDEVLAAMDAAEHRTILLHGVTGSGKTEVYIQAIGQVVRRGQQAIVLVPEISLTPQTKQRFRARFGEVALLHSHLTDAERSGHWERIARGEVSVVVGARSAIFAPTPQLGLIVMDEEHEGSFKQDSAPRYHARDVARRRAEDGNIPLVLGSATPSLESWRRAAQPGNRLVELPRRVLDRPMPHVATIDLRNEIHDRRERGVALSRPLRTAMEQTLKQRGQVILLLNRRGYSTHIQCPGCGHVVRCPDCDIALTHHRKDNIALCHYCEHQTLAPLKCPECNFAGIRYSGLGTQRLEAEVAARFPDDRCLRMDTDSMQKRGAHERALAAFRDGEVRILLGTQMIAKGLDFPNVTLVGVINADTALHLPDFRAAERTFQLLVQVAGRTGRGEKGGQVLVQTFSPDHPAILAAIEHDYDAFVKGELPIRRALGYPPFAHMVRLIVRGPVPEPTRAFADQLGERLRAELEGVASSRVLGPAPCPLPKLRGKYRFQLQANCPSAEDLHAAARAAIANLKPPDNVQWMIDIDPLDML